MSLPVGEWISTAERLPCPVGCQVKVLMWSPEWATWIAGQFTHFYTGGRWDCYDPHEDQYHEWNHVPAWWALVTTPDGEKG